MWLTGCMKGHLMQVVHLLLHVQGEWMYTPDAMPSSGKFRA